MKQDNASRANTRRLRALGIAGGAALLLIATGQAPAAITPSNVDPWQHIIDCARALFDDPPAHAQFCEPGPNPVDFKSDFTWTGPTATPPAPPSSSQPD